MDIVDRLNLFLNQTRISKSKFADRCGIPRPTVSQILSGRNKKISDDIISKIHTMYPRLSILWLMFGEGAMLFGEEGEMPNRKNSLFQNDEIAIESHSANQPKDTEGYIEENSKSRQKISGKYITKIVVFYSDNSFEEFFK